MFPGHIYPARRNPQWRHGIPLLIPSKMTGLLQRNWDYMFPMGKASEWWPLRNLRSIQDQHRYNFAGLSKADTLLADIPLGFPLLATGQSSQDRPASMTLAHCKADIPLPDREFGIMHRVLPRSSQDRHLDTWQSYSHQILGYTSQGGTVSVWLMHYFLCSIRDWSLGIQLVPLD